MDLKLTGKVALVSASSAGIGFAIAKGLAREGVALAMISRSAEKLKSAETEILRSHPEAQMLTVVCDLAHSEQITKMFSEVIKKFKTVDILINNQGGPAPGSFEAVTEDQTDSAWQINVKAVIQLTKLGLPFMKAKRWGRIVNILSVSAKQPMAGMFLSNLVRPPILGLTKTVSSELASSGITINSILPSAILTDRTKTLVDLQAKKKEVSYEQALADAAKTIPVGYIGKPEELSELALFLCSPLASYITGTAISVDGGAGLGLF